MNLNFFIVNAMDNVTILFLGRKKEYESLYHPQRYLREIEWAIASNTRSKINVLVFALLSLVVERKKKVNLFQHCGRAAYAAIFVLQTKYPNPTGCQF